MQTRIAAVALGLSLSAAPALADAIDGDWCHTPDNRRLSIRGSDIVTPGGRHTQGEYTRHYFTYVAPAAEPHAGQTVHMQLLDENTVHLRVGTVTTSQPEMWVRCSPSISMLRMLRRP